MEHISDILKELTSENLEAYHRILEECAHRKNETEGIPAIIGLSDLTQPADDREITYECAPEDQELKYMMAIGALLYTRIFSEKDPEELGPYPPIAPAMGAMASTFFQMSEDGKVLPYFELIKEGDGDGTV